MSCRPRFMVSKERINRPKLCLRVIRPRIIFHYMMDHFYFGPPFLFLFIFTLTHFSLGFFSFCFFFYFFAYFCILFFFERLHSLWVQISFQDWNFSQLVFWQLVASWSFVIFEILLFDICPPMWRVILDWDSERKSSSSKEVTTDNFLYQWRGDEKWMFVISNIVT